MSLVRYHLSSGQKQEPANRKEGMATEASPQEWGSQGDRCMENAEERMPQIPGVALGEKAGWGYGEGGQGLKTGWACREWAQHEGRRHAWRWNETSLSRVSSSFPLPKLLSPQAGLMSPWYNWASLVAQKGKNLPEVQETWVQSLGQEDPLEKGMATHSGILARRIPRTEEAGGLQSIRSQRVRHDWMTNTLTLVQSHTPYSYWKYPCGTCVSLGWMSHAQSKFNQHLWKWVGGVQEGSQDSTESLLSMQRSRRQPCWFPGTTVTNHTDLLA